MKNVFHQLKIIEKSFLTDDAVLLTFDVPTDLGTYFNFLPGQYIILRSEINNEEIRRSYSICTSPEENKLSVVVKAIEGGLFSNFIKDEIEIGHYLDVSSPEGNFFYSTSEKITKNIFLIAAGSGITPIISMAKGILHNEPLTTITLLFANRSIEDTIFYEHLASLQTESKDRLKIIYIFSRKTYGNHYFGKVDDVFFNDIIHQEIDLKQIYSFYICGPEEMVKNIQNYLYTIEIAKDKIKTELFYSLENEVGIEQIVSEEIKSGRIEVEVIVNQESYFATIDHTKNLLESLLDEGLDIPYSCKKGNCSSCVGKVMSGTISMKETDVLMDYEIEEGFILSCQSVPTSEKLIISYDEY
ncbi:ferredoxin--NADP reductase [Chryseobacterium sp. 18068]|uniref:ferredoxin--NADP reductase n=1 Tax=Chryseobacterium sp. 18068 TaxID=2681414 RepID=UPI00135A11C7|nr:ferredoxin--NADP reductase [Chryseobacterium sp. 18068]